MRWNTTTEIPDYDFTVNHQSRLLLLGSCFAENIGARLDAAKFRAVINPMGIAYNPLSLLRVISVLSSDQVYAESDLEQAESRFFSYDHHSRFNAPSAEETLAKINAEMAAAREKLSETDVVFISLGTAFYWWHKTNARIVNNCHKQPGNLFEQKRASVEEVRSALTEAIILLQKTSPNVQVVFTISPIRHLKHGSAGNQLSKATLLVAAQELAEGFENVHYFPSYELLLDDLRDYRWYEEDLIHPNKQALDYVWQRFNEAFFTLDTTAVCKEVEAVQAMLNHRLLEPGSEASKAFIARLKEKVYRIEVNQNISFKTELANWKAKWLNHS